MQELTPTEADAAIRASWPPRRAAEPQPMAAEAATEVDELPASSEYDFPRTAEDRAAAARFWSRCLLSLALLASAAGVWRFLPA